MDAIAPCVCDNGFRLEPIDCEDYPNWESALYPSFTNCSYYDPSIRGSGAATCGDAGDHLSAGLSNNWTNISTACCVCGGGNKIYGCRPCPEGPSFGDECEICAAGNFKNTRGNNLCTNCSAGSYQPSSGQTECLLCENGYHGQLGSAPGATACTVCGPGKYVDGQCIDCPAGKYGQSYGRPASETCYACLAGKYSLQGATICSECAAGSYSLPSIGIGNSQCTLCAPGTALWFSGAFNLCPACAAGTFAASSGQSVCQSCPSGQYQSQTGASRCSNCETQGGPIGSTSVETCSCLRYGYGAGLLGYDCEDMNGGCPSHSNFCNFRENFPSQCCTCGGGRQVPRVDCTPCPPSSTSVTNSTEEADCECDPGYTGTVATECQPCSVGTFKGTYGTDSCVNCPAGTYQNFSGQSTCVDCSAGTYQPVYMCQLPSQDLSDFLWAVRMCRLSCWEVSEFTWPAYMFGDRLFLLAM